MLGRAERFPASSRWAAREPPISPQHVSVLSQCTGTLRKPGAAADTVLPRKSLPSVETPVSWRHPVSAPPWCQRAISASGKAWGGGAGGQRRLPGGPDHPRGSQGDSRTARGPKPWCHHTRSRGSRATPPAPSPVGPRSRGGGRDVYFPARFLLCQKCPGLGGHVTATLYGTNN